MFNNGYSYDQGYNDGYNNRPHANPYTWGDSNHSSYSEGYSKGVHDRKFGFSVDKLPPKVQLVIRRIALVVLLFIIFDYLSEDVDPVVAFVVTGGLAYLFFTIRKKVYSAKKKRDDEKAEMHKKLGLDPYIPLPLKYEINIVPYVIGACVLGLLIFEFMRKGGF